ncbi:MAG: hypothetical protein U9R06_01940 [Patescibacteria group bacterium]|nr:hypothetical protein [Patescibacteria group bacterium]
MREILTLSLPAQAKNLIKKRAKNKGFASVSGYIKYLIKLDDDLISEEELMNSVREARRGYKQGNLKQLKSLKDLV